MSYLREKVSYLRGLAEGMQISESTNEGKLLKAMLEVMDDFAIAIDEVEEIQEQLGEQVDGIDEDLAEIESIVLDGEEAEEDEDFCVSEIECPYCKGKIDIDDEVINEETETIECPHCHKSIELDWECDCEDCCDHE